MITHPNAKINLGLHILRKRPDGYHDIQTIFYPIPLSDTLQVRPAADTNTPYTLTGNPLPTDCPPLKNLVVRALLNLKQDHTIPPLHITLDKAIPSGAGLGGGSSDAAHMMKILNKQFQLNLSDSQIIQRLTTLGADCPFFIHNKCLLATGIGNIFTPCNLTLTGMNIVIIKPNISIPTPLAYSLVTPRPHPTPLQEIIKNPINTWKDLLTNDFEQGIFKLHPQIAHIKTKLYDLGAHYAAMSGSGSAIFGLFTGTIDNHTLSTHFPHTFRWQGILD